MEVTLEERFIELSNQFSELQKSHKELQNAYAELLRENNKLKEKIVELEDKLGINSSNSGLPTSREIYRKEKKHRLKSHRSIGGQVGHKYNGYMMKDADEVVEVKPEEERCVCGINLELLPEYKVHQSIELPEIKPIVTEYHLYQKQCPGCSKKYKSKPKSRRLLGAHAMNIISVLTGFFNNSKREVQEILGQIFNLDVSLGLISNTEERVSKGLAGKYEELREQALESEYLHMDETGHRQKGKRGWCWLAANEETCVFKLDQSRGTKALERFIPDYQGKVISDRYPVYNIYEKENRQICLAHLRRDFKRFAHSKNEHLSKLGNNLLNELDKVFILNKAHKEDKIDRTYFIRHVGRSRRDMLYLLNKVKILPSATQAQRVADNILKNFEMMWLFTKNHKIELTNNFAERQIKHFVKYRKNSFFTWSDRGDRFLERIKSIYATAKQQKLNPFLALSQIS